MGTKIANNFVTPRPLRRLEERRVIRDHYHRQNPQAVRRGDVLRVPGEGDYVVCRFVADDLLPYYVCTNGVRTRKILRLTVARGLIDHYRGGEKINHRC